MNILVLGATSRTGRLVVNMALANRHNVTAIIRDLSKKTEVDVNYIVGSTLDENLLDKALHGIDAVIFSLGLNFKTANPFSKITSPPTIISDSMKTLIPAMERNKVKRIISVSASGVGDSWMNMPFYSRWLIRSSNIWKVYKDHAKHERHLRESTLAWTIVQPVMLDDQDNESYKAIIGKPTAGRISRKGVARFIIDTLETGDYKHNIVTLNY